jgi:hypothetical protein
MYFIAWKGQRDGPYSLEQLAGLLERGEIGLLHRVETPGGLVPLRQLLIETDPARWAGLAGRAAPVASPTATLAPMTPAAPPPGDASSSNSAPSAAKDDARAYALCGLCFLFPPLAIWTTLTSRQLANQGRADLALRLRWLGLGLALSGLVFWVLMWRQW